MRNIRSRLWLILGEAKYWTHTAGGQALPCSIDLAMMGRMNCSTKRQIIDSRFHGQHKWHPASHEPSLGLALCLVKKFHDSKCHWGHPAMDHTELPPPAELLAGNSADISVLIAKCSVDTLHFQGRGNIWSPLESKQDNMLSICNDDF